MNATALNGSSAPQQSEKPSKAGANKAQGDGSEAAHFSGLLQQYFDTGSQNQESGISNASGGHKDLADGSQTAIETRLSALLNLAAQFAPHEEACAYQSAESSAQLQKNVGTLVSPPAGDLAALHRFDSLMAPLNQSLLIASDPFQMSRCLEPVIAEATSVHAHQAEMAASSRFTQIPANDAMKEALNIVEGLSETPAQVVSFQTKLSKFQGPESQSGDASITQSSQTETSVPNLESIATGSTVSSKGQRNPIHHSEAASAARMTVGGLQSQKVSPSIESASFVQNPSEGMNRQLAGNSTLEDTSLAPQLPRSASVRELPAIWTQHAQLLRAGETKTLRMMLNPERLGALEIELRLKNGVLSGTVSVETELAHDLIQKQLPHFLSTLDSKQIASGSFEMHYRGETGGFSDSEGRNAPNNPSRQTQSIEHAGLEQGLMTPQETTGQNYSQRRIDLLA